MSEEITMTTIAYQLKRIYGDKITELFSRQSMTYNMFLKSSRNVGTGPRGVGYYFALRQSDIQSVGSRGEGYYIPEPLAGSGVQGVITPRYMYGTLRLSGPAVEAGKGNLAAFAEVQGDAIASTYKALVTDLNRQCWGDGFGKLAVLSAASGTPSSSTYWTATCNNDLGTRYLQKGMVVDVFSSAGAIDADKTSLRIYSINPTAKTVTFEKVSHNAISSYGTYHPRGYTTSQAVGSALASADQLVRQGARDSSFATTDTPWELTGMDAMFDDGTLVATFEGVTVATYPEFKANILGNSDVKRELSIDLMLQGMDMTATRSDERVDTIITGLGQRRKYFALLSPDVRYTAGSFEGGYETLAFAQGGRVALTFDPHCQPNRMYMFPRSAIKKYEMTPISWGGIEDGKAHWREMYDQATMFLRTYTNLGVEKRNALTLIDDLTEPTGQPW